jgi:hypothetical protein
MIMTVNSLRHAWREARAARIDYEPQRGNSRIEHDAYNDMCDTERDAWNAYQDAVRDSEWTA